VLLFSVVLLWVNVTCVSTPKLVFNGITFVSNAVRGLGAVFNWLANGLTF